MRLVAFLKKMEELNNSTAPSAPEADGVPAEPDVLQPGGGDTKKSDIPEKVPKSVKKKSGKPEKQKKEPFLKDRKTKIRFVLFIIAVIVAVTSITYGVVQIGHKDPGYHTIELELDDSVPYYSNGVTFSHYFDGSSDEIKAALKYATGEYTFAMKESFRLLDGVNTYDVTPGNIAALNKSGGEKIKVGSALYSVLKDAYSKTLEQKGFNMFAGPYYALWQELLYNFDGAGFDPLVNSDEFELIEKFSKLVNDIGSFELTFDDTAQTVSFKAPAELKALLEDYGMNYPIIDLNVMYDAYRLEMVADMLETAGLDAGYLADESGVTVALSKNLGIKYIYYTLVDDVPRLTAVQDGGPGSAASYFRARPLSDDEVGFYTVQGVYRHPYLTAYGHSPLIASSLVESDNASVVDVCYLNVCLNACKDESAAAALVRSNPGFGFYATFLSDDKTLYYGNTENVNYDYTIGVSIKKF